VCPLSVLSNWQKQITDHVVNGKLSCYTYHAENKAVSATTLASYDVICCSIHRRYSSLMAIGGVDYVSDGGRRTPVR
jgi:hypothetical protein